MSDYYRPERINDYQWVEAGGLPAVEYRAFTTMTSRSIYADVCKTEQVLANTLQHRRLVALVSGNIVVDYTIIEPDPHSAHRVTR
jgi:hypothetical protein